ncbi:outer membrane protein assembly factor BamD [Sansalvadorimonas sp. 2012CJ34-2]|uniref:Outer membrane protein assembly factor BamD n=1 Tax=Parendozoicomonas callyspongiae TaxID=2942213 RepID=A0ABT0PCD8_9GAMM|nr:outer membrane protein assembly factor BamD [Sansalvadorimonas sp. 2012CJ34-2]MCL6268958.1 outer membrane protein assembly factor BamD [Sansalvadorimonas sp. 2012CJ34-2]
MRSTKHILILAMTLVLTACSSTETKVPENLTEAELYEQSSQALSSGLYSVAVDKLRILESRYPFGPFAEQAQLDLVYAYYMSTEPEASRAAAERFIRLHPQHPNVDYAYYMRGLASNTADLGLLERYVPVDLSRRDPGQARQSFNEFAELLRRFPESRYAPDARQRMIYLRNRLARYEMHAADYYLKRKAYVAAVNRGRYVVEHLQGTPSTEEALAVMIEGYQHLGLNQPADEALLVLKTNFPDSTLINAEGEFIGRRIYNDVDPSLLNTVTFGLIGSNDPAPRQRSEVIEEEEDSSMLSTVTFGLFGNDDEDKSEAVPEPPKP